MELLSNDIGLTIMNSMNNVKVIVFDIGGTLMEYKNMPNVWIEFYQSAFYNVKNTLNLPLDDNDIKLSIEKLKTFNPRVNYREIDYSPEYIFKNVTEHWKCEFSLNDIINTFFSSMNLTPYIYPETINLLNKLKDEEYKIAVLTDVATGMPDELHKSFIKNLLPYFDMYVSSSSCGYRKPNPKGLQDIAEYFGVVCDDMVFIGDEEKDIKTAKRFECKSMLVDRYNKQNNFGQDYTINNLNELAICLGFDKNNLYEE